MRKQGGEKIARVDPKQGSVRDEIFSQNFSWSHVLSTTSGSLFSETQFSLVMAARISLLEVVEYYATNMVTL